MKKPDWSKAPTWATMYGLLGARSMAAWANKNQYRYVDEKSCTVYKFEHGNAYSFSDFRVFEHRPQWTTNVDGFPVPGTVCEVLFPKFLYHWFETRVVGFDSNGLCVVESRWDGSDHPYTAVACPSHFRPVKSKEEKEIELIQNDINMANSEGESIATYLHSKGYRKPEL